MATISFDLVSPENLVFNDNVGSIIVPGKDGDIGILPGHSKVMSSLRPGRVMVYSEDNNLVKSFFVSAGFVEINPEKCILLAETVNEMNDLDKSTIENEIKNWNIAGVPALVVIIGIFHLMIRRRKISAR